MSQVSGSLDDVVSTEEDSKTTSQLPWEFIIKYFDACKCGSFPLLLADPGQAIDVEDSSDCLWISLREALVHVGVSTLEDDLRKETLKSLQLIEDGSKQDQDPITIWMAKKSKDYIKEMSKPQTRATPFEVYLAALRFECRIFLRFKEQWYHFGKNPKNEFSPVIRLQCSCKDANNFYFQWFKTTFPIFKLEIPAECDPNESLAACLQASLCHNDARPASAPRDFKFFYQHAFFKRDVVDGSGAAAAIADGDAAATAALGAAAAGADDAAAPVAALAVVVAAAVSTLDGSGAASADGDSPPLSPEQEHLAKKVADFYYVKVQFFTESPLYTTPYHKILPSGWTGSIHQECDLPVVMIFYCCENKLFKWISVDFSKTKELEDGEKAAASDGKCSGGERRHVYPDDLTELFQKLFGYPQDFERFFAVLQLSSPKQGDKQFKKMKDFFYKCFRSIDPSTPLKRCHEEMFQKVEEFPNQKGRDKWWDVIKQQCRSIFQNPDTVESSAHPFASFIFWIMTHCRIKHRCCGAEIIQSFLRREPDSFLKMVMFLRILYEYRVWHFFDKKDDYTTQCMFEGNQHVYLFSLCNCEAPNALNDFAKLQLETSFMTSRWLRRNTGRSYKLWGHLSEHEYDKCEVQKCTSKSEKWRHMIYAYAIMALLWNEYNGNKEGPIGDYPDRRDSEIGRMLDPSLYQSLLSSLRHIGSSASATGATGESLQSLLKDLEQAKFVFPSKQGEKPADYHGHNIVALAVGKRGDILRIAYNHNTLFCSTVDHAEERLIDGLYKDPEAFVQKSHARIYDSNAAQKQKMEVEKHMQHISVYTSLEQCQQCAGKFHLALVPEVIFCQRDWEIQLLQEKLYEQHHKCRPVPASFFGFPPYEELAMGYLNYCEKIDASGESDVVFFRYNEKEKPVPAKKTMPYFLCSNEAQQIFRRGSVIFHKVLRILFHQDQRNRPRFTDDETIGIPGFFDRTTDSVITVTDDDVKSLIEAYNLDVSEWMTRLQELNDSPKSNDAAYPSALDSACDQYCGRSSLHQTEDEDAVLIRNYRPSLRSKQNRLWQDELISRRKRWTDNLFKQRCTLKFFFDKYAVIDELDIDRNIGPLGEIRSVYLGRLLVGGGTSLKGSFDVTFSSVSTAKEVKKYFLNVAMTKSGKVFLKNESVVSPDKRHKVIAAANWLYLIREPNQCELFIPHDFPLPSTVTDSFVVDGMERQFPGQTTSTKVKVLKFLDLSSKRKIQKHYFGLPRITLPQSVHHSSELWPEDDTHFDASRYLSLISRIDVSVGELLELLRKCVTRNSLKVQPPHYRIYSSKLTTCNSNKTLKWLHFVAETPTVVDWKLWNIKFKTNFEFDMKGLQASLRDTGTNKFCQSYPQSVFDFAFSFISLDGPCSIRWNPFSVPKPEQCVDMWDGEKMLFCLTIVMDQSSNPNQRRIRILKPHPPQVVSSSSQMSQTELTKLQMQQKEEFDKQMEQTELNFMVYKDYSIWKIEKVPADTARQIKINENCIATLIVSDMLLTNANDIECLWQNWKHIEFDPTIGNRVVAKQHDFWGDGIQQILKQQEKQQDEDKQLCQKLSFKQYLETQRLRFDQFLETLKLAKLKNVFGFAIQSICSDASSAIDFTSNLQPHRAELVCRYCGIRTVLTGVGLFCGNNVHCIGHINHEKKREEIFSFGKYVTELSDNREQNETNDSVYRRDETESKIKSKVNSSIEKINSLERQLGLSMTVQSSISFDNVIKEQALDIEAVCGSVCAEDSVPPHLPWLHLELRRDAFDGPAHVAFRIDSFPNFNTPEVFIQILENVFHSPADISEPFPCSPLSNATKSTVAVVHESNLRLYGKLAAVTGGQRSGEITTKTGKTYPEGGVIPAIALRYFFEPEYFRERFLRDHRDTLADPVASTASFPTINVVIQGSDQSEECGLRVNSWNFEELQSHPLRKLLQLLQDLQMERMKLNTNEKKSLDIKRTPGRQSARNGHAQWYLHCDELQKGKLIAEKILFANLVQVNHEGRIVATYQIPMQFNTHNDTSFFPVVSVDIDSFLLEKEYETAFSDAVNMPFKKKKQSAKHEDAANRFVEFVETTLLGIGRGGCANLNPLTQKKISDSLKSYLGREGGAAAKAAAAKTAAAKTAAAKTGAAKTAAAKVAVEAAQSSLPGNATAANASSQLQRSINDGLFNVLSSIFPEVPCVTHISSILNHRQSSCDFKGNFDKFRKEIRNLGSQFHHFVNNIRQALLPPSVANESCSASCDEAKTDWKMFKDITCVREILPKLAAVLIQAILGSGETVSCVACDDPAIVTCKNFLETSGLLAADVEAEFWRKIQETDANERWSDAYEPGRETGIKPKKMKKIDKDLAIKKISDLNAKIESQTEECLQFHCPILYPEKSAIQTLETFKFFLQNDWFRKIQHTHLIWLLEKGKSLERACDFSTALKYYFVGNIYFYRFGNRIRKSELGRELQSLQEEFNNLYDALLPMTNAEAYSKARESVHYQNVVLKRGTMSK